jgi:hypothetical protein
MHPLFILVDTPTNELDKVFEHRKAVNFSLIPATS